MPMFMHTGYQVTVHFEDMCIYGALVKNITSTQNSGLQIRRLEF